MQMTTLFQTSITFLFSPPCKAATTTVYLPALFPTSRIHLQEKATLSLSRSLSLSHICSLSPTEAALSPHTWRQAANALKVISNMSIRTPTRFLFSRAEKKNINTPFWGRNGLSQHSGAALRNDVPPIFPPTLIIENSGKHECLRALVLVTAAFVCLSYRGCLHSTSFSPLRSSTPVFQSIPPPQRPPTSIVPVHNPAQYLPPKKNNQKKKPGGVRLSPPKDE